jgi:hypothetical protein
VRNPIDDAIAALRRGDQAKAFALLRGQLTRDPKDATAWLWMSEATPNLESKIDALERFIAMAPDHPRVPSAHIRLQYLKSQREQVISSPLPTIEIDKDEAEDEPTAPPEVVTPPSTHEPIRPTPRPTPTAPIEPPTTPAQRESLLSGVARFTPRPTPLPVEGTPPASVAPMTVQTPPARTPYQPAMPDLLQSLLDTAPMPRVRNDSPQEPRPSLDTAPRSVVRPTEIPHDEADEGSDNEANEFLATPMADSEALSVPKSRATPWWAWTLILLMALQILLLVYIILRIELVLATVR